MAKENHTYEGICAAVKAHNFQPVYVLMGEEPYFIDRITDLLIDNVLTEDERVFNQVIMYGADIKVNDIIDSARQYPSMMANRRLVVVREAQLVRNIELLESYVKKPLESTVLVINYKYKKLDRRKSFAQAVEKNGVLFDSEKIAEYIVPRFITKALKDRNIGADQKTISMLADFIGNDLSTLYRELDKLNVYLSNKSLTRLTPEIVEQSVGVSKEYNNFELISAIAAKNVLKANKIIRNFIQNPKEHPLQPTLATLFNYFSNLFICLYEPACWSGDRPSESGIMQLFGFRYSIQASDYLAGMRGYTKGKVFAIIREIRLADARSKGFGMGAGTQQDESDILKELLYKILH
ncbi:MAG: DNA polymerase III subunit delta [Tannerella sp.]|jgi:DNA polymerase-3 subunit delta|nr:DNA polymerase III subunit delta [Tannerella sp.]